MSINILIWQDEKWWSKHVGPLTYIHTCKTDENICYYHCSVLDDKKIFTFNSI